MKYRYIYFYSLWISVWFTLPVFASPDRAPNSGKNGNAPTSFILKVQDWQKERGALSYGSERFRHSHDWFNERESRDRSNDSGMRSYSDFLGPTFDMPGSVNGRNEEPWWIHRAEPEPMLKDLRNLNRESMKSR